MPFCMGFGAGRAGGSRSPSSCSGRRGPVFVSPMTESASPPTRPPCIPVSPLRLSTCSRASSRTTGLASERLPRLSFRPDRRAIAGRFDVQFGKVAGHLGRTSSRCWLNMLALKSVAWAKDDERAECQRYLRSIIYPMAARPRHTPSLRAPAQPALPLTASRCRKPFRPAGVVWRRFRPSPKPEWTRASVPPPSRSLQNGVLDERGRLPEASAKAAPIDASCRGTSKAQTAYVREHSNEREVDLDGYSSRLGLSVSGLRGGAPFQRLLENQDPMRRVPRGQHC